MREHGRLLNFDRCLVLVAFAAWGTTAKAGTIDLSSADWSTSGTTTVTVSSTANGLIFTLPNADAFSAFWTFSSTASADAAVTFNWELDALFSWYEASETVTAWDYDASGTENTYTLSSGSVSGWFDYTGSSSLTVYAGKTYGFTVSGSNYDSSKFLEGTFTLSNPVPEPASALLILPGLAAAAFRARRKRKA